MSASRHLVGVALTLAACAGPAFAQRDEIPARPEGGYSLDMLTGSQQAKLTQRIENYALATSLLNHCGKRPETEKRALEAAEGCVAPASLRTIAERFASKLKLVSRNARWNCRSDDAISMIARMEQAIDLTIQDIRAACGK